MLEEHALDSSVHDRASFDCGIPALDEYLQRFAEQHRRRGISAAYVLVDSTAPAMILGYYTLSAAEVPEAQEAAHLAGLAFPGYQRAISSPADRPHSPNHRAHEAAPDLDNRR